jgi:predicted membrane channel-forming protein YqfA (hemolysin III family)
MNEKQFMIFKMALFIILVSAMLYVIWEQKTIDDRIVEALKNCDYQEICKTCSIQNYIPQYLIK